MKYLSLIVCLCVSSVSGYTQATKTNTFPESGNAGIGYLTPAHELDIRGSQPLLQLFERASGGNRRLQLSIGINGEVRFLSTFGSGGNYPFTFRFGGSRGEVMRIGTNGNVGIGTATPAERLSVNGNIRAKEVKVETANWPDYVFEDSYPLISLEDLKAHIKEKGHLPGIPTAEEVEAEGIALAEMNRKLLEKVEELTLYILEQQREINQLKEKTKNL